VDKVPPPLLGFNNNVRHHGRIFHIQTEDSGVKHARIVTHLFADGGRIVNSVRTDYSEHVGRPDMADLLRRIMKEQHKAMFIRLRAGELDGLIEAACGPLPVVAAPRPSPPPPPTSHTPPQESSSPPDQSPLQPVDEPHSEEGGQRRRRLTNPNLRPAPPSVAPAPGELELDEDLLAGGNLPPAAQRKALAPARFPAGLGPTAQSPEGRGEARYAPPRPPNIFQASEQGILGEGLIREKSLDEVILSYLADDLDRGSNK
jgi:hypothetical protein